jgi:hypothetical protein
LESFSINTFALVAKISQDAKERKWTGKQVDLTAPGREGAKGETTEVLAEIAGVGTCKYEALVEKISQAAKERQSPGTNQYTKRSGSVPTGTTSEPGEVSKKLAKIAGTGK